MYILGSRYIPIIGILKNHGFIKPIDSVGELDQKYHPICSEKPTLIVRNKYGDT